MPFEEVAKRASTGTLLSMAPPTVVEQAQYAEYVKYFRTKMRCGVAKIDSALSLYVLPPSEDVPAIRDSLYVLGPQVPRDGCLLGLIAAAAPVPAAAAAPTAAAA